MLAGRPYQQWIAQYAASHRDPVNRACHTVGIPCIAISIVLMVAAIFAHPLLKYGLALFLLGWALQFAGHLVERTAPEFFHDWRFLLVGLRWWWAKLRGQA